MKAKQIKALLLALYTPIITKTVELNPLNLVHVLTLLYMEFKTVNNFPRIASLAMKSLKIPKEQSESVYRSRTDNTMVKRKSTKGQTTIYETYI